MIDNTAQTAGAHVSARGWSWRYGSRPRATFNQLDLEISPGERVLLLGASGSGKSTLVAGLAGVLGEDEGHESGHLLVDGTSSRTARGRVGLVLQDPENQVILHRIGDDVAFGCENLGIPQAQIWPRVTQALAAVGLNLPLDRSTAHLSGGQKQRLALAGVLAMRPGLIILDEPTANLDPDGVAEIRRAVEVVARDTEATLIIVEHRVDVWWELVTRVIVLDSDGSILRDGAPDAVLASAREPLTRAGIWLPGTTLSSAITRSTTRATTSSALTSPASPAEFVAASSQDPLLVATSLTVGRSPSAPAAASDLTLGVTPGQIHAIVGPNGSGKSTLALTLAGLLAPLSGYVTASASLVAGARTTEPLRWRSHELLTRIGMVFQSPEHQFLTGSVRDEVMVGPRALARRASSRQQPAHHVRCDELLDRLHLSHLAGAHPFTLSGGEKRRLSVATALATAPHVLVLDEPTFGQDARTWSELVALFAELRNDGHAVVAVTHDERLVTAAADVVTTLSGAVLPVMP